MVETNFGGDMVIDTVEGVDPHVPLQEVRASRGKSVRADPIVAKYEQEKVFHSPGMIELEREQLRWSPTSTWSPGRIDALVFALTELLLLDEGPLAIA